MFEFRQAWQSLMALDSHAVDILQESLGLKGLRFRAAGLSVFGVQSFLVFRVLVF